MPHVRDVRMLVDRRVVNVDVCMLTNMRTGEYLVYGRRWLPTEPWTAERFVAQAKAVVVARE